MASMFEGPLVAQSATSGLRPGVQARLLERQRKNALGRPRPSVGGPAEVLRRTDWATYWSKSFLREAFGCNHSGNGLAP